ncbi:MAG: hypothetical protein E7619_07805, partial [Ruminococcaceae bacterium]|nr:hypothetical protein [Oscillospiraceae bacterium]
MEVHMKNTLFKRSLNLILAFVMIICSVPMPLAFAASPTVEIVSFARGPQTDLRSSELLEARVSGYEGNVQDLTYKWTNGLGTYLYVYNSHNMHSINDTDGEIEIYNDSVTASSNMSGRAYKYSFSGKGYAWAAVYYSNGGEELSGTISVEVYDAENNLLCSDSHTGSRVQTGTTVIIPGILEFPRYSDAGVLEDDLQGDLEYISLGLFEGDSTSLRQLFGENGIVHITCTACSVGSVSVTNDSGTITAASSGDDYAVTGVTAGTSTSGDATISATVTKDNCKFHNGDSARATIPVFVFKKPTTTTAATTLTLTGNFDSRCEYYLEGVKGTEGLGDSGERVVYWTGLNPNTRYEVEIRAKYVDQSSNEHTVYAWIYDTTLPVYSVIVNTLLDGVHTDIEEIHEEDASFYLGEVNAATNEVYIPLTRTSEGVYSAPVGNGRYHLWHKIGNDWHQAGTTDLIVNGANAEMTVYHYSVKYDANDGSFAAGENPGTENYAVGSAVTATDKIPVREGYLFAGWQWNGSTYASGERVTNGITAPMVLTAVWEKSVSVTINVNINHSDDNGHTDMNGATKGDVAVVLNEKKAGSSLFVPTEHTHTYDVTVANDAATTTHNGLTFTGLHSTSEFAVSASKHGYDVSYGAPVKDSDGNWTLTVNLDYNFDDFDLAFEVEMDDEVPAELYPASVNVRIQIFYAGEWHTIDQLSGNVPPIFVTIDPATGKGSGSYPVWKHLPDGTTTAKYRIIVTSFTYKDGTARPATEQTAHVVYTDGNYTATVGEVADGELCGTVKGAYFDGTAQKGVLDAVVTVEKYNVTFNANGGTVNGNATQTVNDLYYVPDFDGYVPARDNYKFIGWYEDVALTVPATEGKLLTEDITLYAKWEAIQTITGTVNVSITDNDGIEEILVELFEIVGDAENLVDAKTVAIGGSFSFRGLSEAKTYRIFAKAANYTTLYQNEDTAAGTYNENDYVAVFKTVPTSTYVNVMLDFEPVTYVQPLEVDASAIGVGFRPASALAKILFRVVNSGDAYLEINEHLAADAGVNVAIGASGVGSSSFDLWGEFWNGVPYEYQARVTELNGGDPAALPVYINYGNSVRYSPINNAPTGTLRAIIMPRGFNVVFDLNAGADPVYGMDEYEDNGVYKTSHVWSFDTEITAEPVRQGYVFKGWKLATPDAAVYSNGKVLAAVAEDVTLIAEWEKAEYQYTVEYYFDGVIDV